jgi:hypothetical protein
VQHGKHANACAEMAWIGRDLEQSLRCCPKQQVVEKALIPECQWRQLLGHRKDHMDVGHRQ